MDIAERRVPQDGRIKMRLSKNRAIDFRVNTCPTLFGEKTVMRLLDSSMSIPLDALGYEPFQLDVLAELHRRPVAVTGDSPLPLLSMIAGISGMHGSK